MLVFVFGEMLWVPTSQAIVAGLAPEDVRGAYMGAFGSTAAIGFALGPFTGLRLQDVYGENAAWLFFAAVSRRRGRHGCDRRSRSPGPAGWSGRCPRSAA